MMVLPPGRLSTSTGWFHAFWNSCASVRPSTSLSPPGGNGTTILMGLEGKDWADADKANASAAMPDPIRASSLLTLISSYSGYESLSPSVHYVPKPLTKTQFLVRMVCIHTKTGLIQISILRYPLQRHCLRNETAWIPDSVRIKTIRTPSGILNKVKSSL